MGSGKSVRGDSCVDSYSVGLSRWHFSNMEQKYWEIDGGGGRHIQLLESLSVPLKHIKTYPLSNGNH